MTTLLSLHEYKEWEFLSKYYDGKLDLSDDEAEEFVSLCGERGYSASERLMCSDIKCPTQLIDIASQRALFWQKEYNIYSVIEPDKAKFYKLLVSSYNLLLMQIQNAIKEYVEAKETINRATTFLGLNQRQAILK